MVQPQPQPVRQAAPGACRIAVLEGDSGLRDRLLAVLAADAALQLVWHGACEKAFAAWLRHAAVDVLLLDLSLPRGGSLDVLRICRRLQPQCEVMVVSLATDEGQLLEAFAAGARGHLRQDGSDAELLAQVHALRAGGSPMSPRVARRLLQHWLAAEGAAPPPPRASAAAARPSTVARAVASTVTSTHEGLTPREADVLRLLARGHTCDQAARHLAVSPTTVRTHMRNLYAKLAVHNKAGAVYEARSRGLLE